MYKKLIAIIMLVLLSVYPFGMVMAEQDSRTAEQLAAELRILYRMTDLSEKRFMKNINAELTNGLYTAKDPDAMTKNACMISNDLITARNKVNADSEDVKVISRYIDELNTAYDTFLAAAEMEYEKNDTRRVYELIDEVTERLQPINAEKAGIEELNECYDLLIINLHNRSISLNAMVVKLGNALNDYKNFNESPSSNIDAKDELKKLIDEAQAKFAENRYLFTFEAGKYNNESAAILSVALNDATSVFLEHSSSEAEVTEAREKLSNAFEAFKEQAGNLETTHNEITTKLETLTVKIQNRLKAMLDAGTIHKSNEMYNNNYANKLAAQQKLCEELLDTNAKTEELSDGYNKLSTLLDDFNENIAQRQALQTAVTEAQEYKKDLSEMIYDSNKLTELNESIESSNDILAKQDDHPTTEKLKDQYDKLIKKFNELKSSAELLATDDEIKALSAYIASANKALDDAVSQGRIKRANNSYDNTAAASLYAYLESSNRTLNGGKATISSVNEIKTEISKLLTYFDTEMNKMASNIDKKVLKDEIENAKKLLINHSDYANSTEGNALNKAIASYENIASSTIKHDALISEIDGFRAIIKAFEDIVSSKENEDDAPKLIAKLKDLKMSALNKLSEAEKAGTITMNSNDNYNEPAARNLSTYIKRIEEIINDNNLENMKTACSELESLIKAFDNSLDEVDNNTISEQKKATDELLAVAKDILSVNAQGEYSNEYAKELQKLLDDAAKQLKEDQPDQTELKRLFEKILATKDKLQKYIDAVKKNRNELSGEIAKAEQLLKNALDKGFIKESSDGYNDESANVLLKAVNDARELAKKSDVDLTEFATAMNNIEAASKAFGKLHKPNDELDKSKLNAELVKVISAIDAAEKGLTKYPAGALETIKVILQAAHRAAGDAKSQEDIDAILANLRGALDIFLASQIKDEQTTENITIVTENELSDGWHSVGDKLYYYENGNKTSKCGWININGIWYYLDGEGAAVTGWVKYKGKWYYMQDSDGRMVTGWLKDKEKWYFLNINGDMALGWLKDKGRWYFLSGNGSMARGWVRDNGKWYFLEQSGSMKTGWLKDGGKWYHLQASGAMSIGWIQSGSKWYYLYNNGAMAENTWVGVYKVGADGAWLR